MRFKVDENLPIEIVTSLRDAGHEAESVLDEKLGGAADARLADTCRTEDRVIVTLDLDFANTRAYPPEQFAGFVVLRVGDQRKRHVLAVFERLLPLLAKESPARHLWIVDERAVRIHPGDN